MPHKLVLVDSHRRPSAGVRILLADDFAPWRSELQSFLQCKTDCKIVFGACDGIEAVQKTVELNPDVVLLDIGMPGLNGIEATRRICRLSPNCKIVILAQDGNEDCAPLDRPKRQRLGAFRTFVVFYLSAMHVV